MSVRKYHRKDGEVRWLGMIEEGRDPKTGRRVQASKSFLTKRAAERWCREQTRHIERGEYVESTTQTVGKFLDKWLEAVRPPQVRESTWASFDSHVKNHLKRRIGAVRLQQLDRGRILGLARELLGDGRVSGGGLSQATVRRIVAGTLHIALEYAVQERRRM